MSFDAGEIKAYLVLDKTQFDAALEEARAQADQPIDAKVKPEMDETAVAEVEAEKEQLATPVDFEVKPSYSAGEAEAIGKTIGADVLAGIASGAGGAEGNPLGGLVGSLFGQGLTAVEVKSALQNMGFKSGEIKAALGAGLVDALGSGGGDAAIAQGIAQAALPSGALLDAAMVEELATRYEEIKATTIPVGTGQGGGNFGERLIQAALGQGFTKEEIVTGLAAKGFSASEVAAAVDSVMTGAEADLSGAGGSGGGGGFLSGIMDSISSGWSGLSTVAQVGIAGSPIVAAIVQALGLAGGGALAGTAIGGMGTLAALVPGLLDLMHGYAAYQAQSTGASTSGMSGASLAMGKQIAGLIGAGSKGLGKIEAIVAPDITKFLHALIQAIPLMMKFAGPAVSAMAKFFSMVEQDMGSKRFAGMVAELSKLVGPIMTEFGTTIMHVMEALGPLVIAFGKIAASTIGPWFERVSNAFAKWALHLKISQPYVHRMVQTFDALGANLGPLLKLFVDLFIALAPLGLLMLKLANVVLVPLIKGVDLLVVWLTKLVNWFMNLRVVKDVIGWFGHLHTQTFILQGIVQRFGQLWNGVWGAAAAAIEGAWKIIQKVFGGIIGAVGGVLGAIGSVVNAVGSAWGAVTGFFSTGGPGISITQAQQQAAHGGSGPVMFDGKRLGGHHVSINVDARGSNNPTAVHHAVHNAVRASLPALQAALARGAA